jgi:hypothetical protein
MRRPYVKPTVTEIPGKGDWLRKFQESFSSQYEVVGFKGDAVLVRSFRDGAIFRASGKAEDPRFEEF